MQGEITIKAEERSALNSSVDVSCYMSVSSPLDRFNLILTLAQVLGFDEDDWKLFQTFRILRDRFQDETITGIDMSAIATLLKEE